MTSNTLAAEAVDMEQPLTASELQQAFLFIDQTQNGVVGLLRNLSEVQWKFKPAPDRWSIAEIAEHIIHVQELVLGPIREQLANAPSAAPHPAYQQVDAIVINQIPNRLAKFPSPHQPTGGTARSEAIDRVLKNCARSKAVLESTPDLRQHAVAAPPLQAISKGAYQSMDGYQWILAAAAHAERHTKQMLEVMADAEYPA